MRRLLSLALLAVFTSPAAGAEAPLAGLDRTGSPEAHLAGETLRATARNRLEHRSFAPVAGWTVTSPDDHVIYLQDDGTHGCANTANFNTWFDTCLTGTGGALDAYYGAYPSANPGYIALYSAFDNGFGGAFYEPVANETTGLGVGHFAGQEIFGNVNGLNGFIFMNSLPFYDQQGPQFRNLFFDLIWGQEFLHRWAAFVHVTDGGDHDSKELLGRQDGHWSWFMDTDWSWMEGNDWTDEGGGSFKTNLATFNSGPGFSRLDLYLGGFAPPSAVPPSLLIKNSSGHSASEPPQWEQGPDTTISGDAHMVKVDDIIATEGPRNPAWTEAQRRFQVVNLVVLRSTDNPADTAITSVANAFVARATTQFAENTRNLGHVDTYAVGPLAANANPTASFTGPASAKKGGAAVTFDASASTDSDGTVKGYAWDFGDGSGDFDSGMTVSHVFRKSGKLTVTLVAVDDQGGHAMATQEIDVAGKAKGCGCDLTDESAPSIAALAAGALALIALRFRAWKTSKSA